MGIQIDNPLGTQKVSSLLHRFALPSIVAMLVSSLYNIVDQFFIGHSVGELGNAATNISFPLSISCVAIALLFGIGGSSAFNISMGLGQTIAEEKKKAVYFMGNALFMMVFCGTVLLAVTQLFLQQLMVFFGSSREVLGYASVYTRIVSIGFPFVIGATGGGHLLRADGRPKLTMLCNLVGAVINTALDALFVFGFQWGMAGAAWATILSQFLSAVLSLMVGMRRFEVLHLKKDDFANLGNAMTVHLKTGFPMGFQMCIGQLAMQMVVNSLGTAAVAGYTAASKADQLSVLVNNAMMTAISNYVAQNFGAGKRKRICQGVRASLIQTETFNVLMCGHYITEASDCRTFHVQSDKGDLSLFGCISDDRGTVLCDTGTACCVSYYYSEYAEWLDTICSVYDRAGNEDISNSWTCWNAWLYISMHCKSYGVVWSMCITDSMLLSNDESMEKR